MKSIADMWFVSFADSRRPGVLRRLRRQAKRFGFDPVKTLIVDETGLDASFRERTRDILKPEVRGYGYWSWKPQVILQALSKMDDGDILVYADAGCHLNPRGRDKLLSYIPTVMAQGLGVFQMTQLERHWTKGDLFDYFGSRAPILSDTGQIFAGIVFAQKTNDVAKTFQEHLELLLSRTELVDDSPSHSPNFPGFIQSRYDQSAFSLRCKTKQLKTFDISDTCEINDGLERPIIARRDRGIGWRGYVPFSVKRLCFKAKDLLLHL